MNVEPSVRDEYVTLGGLRFHYRDWGHPAAPPLVLLHGYTMHARTWDTFAAAMAAGFRVLALDQRGFGESDWASDYHEQRMVGDLGAFADALGLATFAAVGISIGGAAALSYAATCPERVEQLVAFECFTNGDETGDAPWVGSMRAHLGTLRSLPESVAAPEEAAAAFRPLATYAPEDELLHWMRGGLTRRPDGRLGWRYDPVFRTPGSPGRLNASAEELRERLARVRCPALLPVGAESWMVEPTERVAAANARAHAVTVPRAGHWVPLDNPRGFLGVVGGFLAGA
jgi:pimeloyl-ACP methyl ester carboxylesterase